MLGGVALRKESVDRNMLYDPSSIMKCQSLSARRAWIEIPVVPAELTTLVKSLSARRAWIEMCDVSLNYKEVLCRSPQGERG